jgi:hypothetical protein
MPPTVDNAKGYWESTEVQRINDEILSTQDAEWDDVFPLEETPLLSNFGAFYLSKLQEVLHGQFGDADGILIKDPRISLLLRFWRRALEQAGYQSRIVIMVRNPMEVAGSLARRDGFSRDKGYLLWLSHMLSAERKSRGERRLFVQYADLLMDPGRVLKRAEASLDLTLPRRSRLADLDVQRAVDSSLRHHNMANPDFEDSGELSRMVGVVYDWMRQATNDEEPDPDVLDEISKQLAGNEGVSGGVLVELKQRTKALKQALDAAQRERAAASDALEAEKMRAGSLESDLESYASKARATEHELRLALEDARAKVEALEQRSSELDAEVEEHRQAQDQLEAELSQARGALTTANDDLSRELAKSVAACTALASERAQRSELETQNASLSNNLTALRADRDALASEAIFANKLNVSLRDTVNRLQQEDARNQLAVNDWQTALDAQQTRLDILEHDLDIASQSLSYIKSRLWWRVIGALKRGLRSGG